MAIVFLNYIVRSHLVSMDLATVGHSIFRAYIEIIRIIVGKLHAGDVYIVLLIISHTAESALQF